MTENNNSNGATGSDKQTISGGRRPADGSEIICCCHGWQRETFDMGMVTLEDYRSGEHWRVHSQSRIFWWYDLDLQMHLKVIPDGEVEPAFVIPDGLPFRVEEASISDIKVYRFPNDQAHPTAAGGEGGAKKDFEI